MTLRDVRPLASGTTHGSSGLWMGQSLRELAMGYLGDRLRVTSPALRAEGPRPHGGQRSEPDVNLFLRGGIQVEHESDTD